LKITFTMTRNANQPKHSTRFNFDAFETGTADNPEKRDAVVGDRFKPSFYIPKPFAEHAKRVRVTIEEL